MASICESITRGYNGRTITIFTDSQAALKTLESVTVRSKMVLGCLDELATHNSVQLVWVPGQEGILGNQRADKLAKKCADTPFTGPEQVLGLPYSVVNQGLDGEETHRVLEVWQRLQALQGPHGNKAGLLNC